MISKQQILAGVFAVIFILLFGRLVQVQLADHGRYARLALENAAKTVPETAPRGVIVDSYGKVLVENRPIFSVQILPHVLRKLPAAEQARVMNLLGGLLGQPIRLTTTANEPIIIKDKVSRETAIKIEERHRQLPGVIVASRAAREYPHGSLAAHLLGYVGEIEAAELLELKEQGYRRKDVVGKDGIEKYYDRQIRGRDGGKKVEVNVHGLPVRLLESLEPEPGGDVKLTLDLGLQQAAEKALGRREGGVVVLDVRNGRVLALASFPNYDPNIFTDPLQSRKWDALSLGRHPFVNRALALYPPGSVFKVVTLAAALQENVAGPDEMFYCPGYYKIHNRIARCWKSDGHGSLNTMTGLVESCNVVFYELGRRLGPDKLAEYARKFGLGSRSGIDLPQEKRGTIPDREWKKTVLKEPWHEGDSINYGIGQGFVQVTPLQLAAAYAGLASGVFYRPFVVDEIRGPDGSVVYKGESRALGRPPVSSGNLERVRGALRRVVSEGTGRRAEIEGFPAAGKTGTAENPGKPHAWFVCYAPVGDPRIAVAVFIAHGEAGDQAAAQAACDILLWYRDYRTDHQPAKL